MRDLMSAGGRDAVSVTDACYIMLLRQRRQQNMVSRKVWSHPNSLCGKLPCGTVVFLVAQRPTQTEKLVAQELGDFVMTFPSMSR